MPTQPTADARSSAKRKVLSLLKSKRLEEAEERCAQWVSEDTDSLDALMLHIDILKRQGRFDLMLQQAKRAYQLKPQNPGVCLQTAEAYIYCGQVNSALKLLQSLEESANRNPELLQQVAGLYTHCAAHQQAARCHRQAVNINPKHTPYLYNLAASLIALGDMEEAEQLLTDVIRHNPRDYDAYQNRSTLKKQNTEKNHIEELERQLQQVGSNGNGEVQLCYALAKELEDMEDYQKSFHYLQRGASRRRSLMKYQVESDLSAITTIQETFSEKLLQQAPPISDENGPIFILGLPRSGTTLVDRIISSHSQVQSLGEINDFAFSLIRGIGGSLNKQEMIKAAANIDFSKLGDTYLNSARSYGGSEPCFIDKTPLNFLYLGLIRLALPQARVIHLRRNPMDSCYAMYKTLFRMGYPFSYHLEDLARYYSAYHQLMAHWRETLPGYFLDVDYEELVQKPEEVSRKLITHCGLEWQDSCLQFHKNKSPAATASAAQVRQPVYTSSLQRWRCYEQQLAPLAESLQKHGIKLEP
ncbi:sulfotransferase [bacterium SCSIO 12696]|nr:sulfotransferase [bacterium SCSIO 12696]